MPPLDHGAGADQVPITPARQWVIGTVLLAVAMLAVAINASEIAGVRASPDRYPFAAHYAAEYGWSYASARHYELACWIGLVSWLSVGVGTVAWLRSRRWWPLLAALSLLIASAVVPGLALS